MTDPRLPLPRRLLNRVRRAKHPLHGWRKAVVIVGQALVGVIGLFALINLGLSLTTFRGEDPLARTVQELQVLWFSPLDGQAADPAAFRTIYGERIAPADDTSTIRDYLAAQSGDGVFLLDDTLIARIEQLNGRVDSRAIPPGIYVGAHALGPDGPPFVPVTKFLAQYLLFPRHSYILVVPETGPAFTFSASQNAKFGIQTNPDQLAAEIRLYDRAAYDYPSSGQALHEMTLVTRDPERIAAAYGRLRAAQQTLEAEGFRYGLLAPNSNTAIGCVLEGSGAISRQARSSILLTLRAPGFGADCDR